METVTNVANAATEAAKAAWGANESTTRREPLSGVQGDAARGEPYDAGNFDDASQERLAGTHTQTTENVPFKSSEGVLNQKEGFTPQTETQPEAADSVPSKSREGAIKQSEGITQQHNEVPQMSKSEMPEVSTPLKAPSANVEPTNAPAPSSSKLEDESKSTEEGTGELYVRTTGLAADGGDFDATKPGAGREADRLMEEKGLHRDDVKGGHDESSKDHKSHGKDKPSLGERIKAKLHSH